MKPLNNILVAITAALISTVSLANTKNTSNIPPTLEEVTARLTSQYGAVGADYTENMEYYRSMASHLLHGNPTLISCVSNGLSHGGVLSTVENGTIRLEYISDYTKKFVVVYKNIEHGGGCKIEDSAYK